MSQDDGGLWAYDDAPATWVPPLDERTEDSGDDSDSDESPQKRPRGRPAGGRNEPKCRKTGGTSLHAITIDSDDDLELIPVAGSDDDDIPVASIASISRKVTTPVQPKLESSKRTSKASALPCILSETARAQQEDADRIMRFLKGDGTEASQGDTDFSPQPVPHPSRIPSYSTYTRLSEAAPASEECNIDDEDSDLPSSSTAAAGGKSKHAHHASAKSKGKAGSEKTTLATSSQPAATAAPSKPKLTLKLQTKNGQSCEIGLKVDDTWGKLFATFSKHAVEQGWCTKSQKLSFVFDDEQLNPDGTPEQLGMEDGDAIDVVVK